MRLHALPQLGLWFVANTKANVQTVAKKRGVCVQLNAILVQGIIHELMQSKRVAQAEADLSKRSFSYVYIKLDLIYSRSACIHMLGVHICHSGMALSRYVQLE